VQADAFLDVIWRVFSQSLVPLFLIHIKHKFSIQPTSLLLIGGLAFTSASQKTFPFETNSAKSTLCAPLPIIQNSFEDIIYLLGTL
jgi:hypothetical protein